MKNSEPIQANLFHAGSTCPFCQESIEEDQMIVRCDQCGAIHHDLCWLHGDGCSSYHCSKKVKTDFVEPEMIITASEARSITPPAKPVRRSAEKIARQYAPPKPESLSKLSIVSLILAALSACGIAGILSGSIQVLTLGVVISIGTLITGVISTIIINNSSRIKGMAYSAVSVISSCFMLILFFTYLYSMTRTGLEVERINLQLSERMPTEAELANMEPHKANAMRANVVVSRGGGSLMGAQVIGSGVILQKKGNDALILTNKHVIGKDADETLKVLFCNGEKSTAKVEWLAPDDIDLALISCQLLTLKNFSSISVSAKLAGQGTKTFAVGNPMNLPWSYTEGVISAIREKAYGANSVAIYQTQTPINQGNSGGGLYSPDGILIGINTWTRDKSVSEGLSFSISSSSFLDLLPDKLLERVQSTSNMHHKSAKEENK